MAFRLLALSLLLLLITGCKGPAPAVASRTELTYELVLTTPDEKDHVAELQGQVVKVFMQRISELGITDARVRPEREDRIVVDLPASANLDEVRRVLPLNPMLGFYEAETVVSPKNNNIKMRPYDVSRPDAVDPDNPVVHFIDRKTGELVAPTMAGGSPNLKYREIIESWGKPILTGKDLGEASFDMFGGSYVPLLRFNEEGAKEMRKWSNAKRNSRENIAIVLNDLVVSIASLENNTVLSDNAVITGTFSEQYVKNLCDALNMSKLPVDVREIITGSR